MLGMENHLHRECELLVEAGLPPLEVLHAATILPAQVLKFSDRDVIEEGNRAVLNRAVLVVLREDPTEDIRATRESTGFCAVGLNIIILRRIHAMICAFRP
jgi:imidazolonepropionase-like amidohydrolase